MAASAHIANLVAHLAEARGVPLQMQGGVGAFSCDGLEFGLEISDNADAILLNVPILPDANGLPPDLLREALLRNLAPELLFSAAYGINAQGDALILYGGTEASTLDEPGLWGVLQRFIDLALKERDYFGTWELAGAGAPRQDSAERDAELAMWTRV